MGTTFNYEIGSRPNRLGKYSIYLRITQDRKPKRVKTVVELSSVNDWNPKRQQVRSSEPRHRKYNDILDKFKQDAKTAYMSLRESDAATAEQIFDKLNRKDKPESFFQYLLKRIDNLYMERRINTMEGYCTLYRVLRKYQKHRGKENCDLIFKEITPAFLSGFEQWLIGLISPKTGRALSPETIFSYFKLMRCLINRAIKIDEILKPEDNPFWRYTIKGDKLTRDKLNASEIARIESLDIPRNSDLWRTRNLFLFSFYCAGIRRSDCLRLRWCNVTNDGRLQYKMNKTGKNQDILLVPQACEILDYYRSPEAKPNDFIFPVITCRKTLSWYKNDLDITRLDPHTAVKIYNINKNIGVGINKDLKIIAQMAGISKKVTFHTARHSFAHVAKEKGADNIVLRDLLKHSSIKTTERYIGSFGDEGNDRALQAIFGDSQADRERSELLERICRLSTKELKDILNNTV